MERRGLRTFKNVRRKGKMRTKRTIIMAVMIMVICVECGYMDVYNPILFTVKRTKTIMAMVVKIIIIMAMERVMIAVAVVLSFRLVIVKFVEHICS